MVLMLRLLCGPPCRQVSNSDAAATVVARMWQSPDDDELQEQACKVLALTTRRGEAGHRQRAEEANQHRGAEAVVAAMSKFPDNEKVGSERLAVGTSPCSLLRGCVAVCQLYVWGVEALIRLVAAKKEQAGKVQSARAACYAPRVLT